MHGALWLAVTGAKEIEEGIDIEKKLNNKLKYRQKTPTVTSPMLVVVLDEIDQLMTQNRQVLRKLFEWADAPKSRLVSHVLKYHMRVWFFSSPMSIGDTAVKHFNQLLGLVFLSRGIRCSCPVMLRYTYPRADPRCCHVILLRRFMAAASQPLTGVPFHATRPRRFVGTRCWWG